MCLAPDVFTGPLRCLAGPGKCTADAQQRDLICNLPKKNEYQSKDAPCLVLAKATGEYCPKAGRYHVWRNLSYDIWVKLPATPSAQDEAVGRALVGLQDLLKIVFKGQIPEESAYADVQVTPTPLTFDGKTCLPRGFTLGATSRGGVAQQVSPAEFFKFLRELREFQLKVGELRKVCEADPTSAACTELTDGKLAIKDAELKGMLAEAARSRNAAQAQAEAAGVVDDPTTPGNEAAQAAQKAAQAAAENSAAESGEPSDKGEKSGRPGQQVEGSGGVLPAGAPPWLADLFDMVLTYFGVSEAVKGAALALYILAPDLLNDLASLSAGLTKDLADENLDKAFDAIASIYRFYQTATTSAASLDKFATDGGYKNAADLLTRTGKMIEAMPESMQKDLRKAVGEDIANGLTKVKNVAGAVDPDTVDAIVSGRGRAALQEQLEHKARETLVDSAAKKLGKELGVDPERLKGALGAVARGDYTAAQGEARKAFSTEVAQRMGIDPQLVESIVSNNASALQVSDLVAGRATAVVAKAMGVPGVSRSQLANIASDLRAGNTNSLGQVVMSQLSNDDRNRLADAINIAQSRDLSATMYERAAKELQRKVPPEFRTFLSGPVNPQKVVDRVLADRMGERYAKLKDSIEKDGAAAVMSNAAKNAVSNVVAAHAAEFPETVAILKNHNAIDNASLLATLRRDASATTEKIIGDALHGTVYRTLDRANLPTELTRAIGDFSDDPAAALQQARGLADATLKKTSTIVESNSGAFNSMLSCANVSEWTASGLSPPKLGAHDPRSVIPRMFATAPPALISPQELKSMLAARCPAGVTPQTCATNACAGLHESYARTMLDLRGYSIAPATPSGAAIPLAQAVLISAAIENAPGLARFARDAAEFGESGATPASVLGKLVKSGLPETPTAGDIADALATKNPAMAAALKAATDGDIVTASRLVLGVLDPERAKLFNVNASVRANALKQWLESPPRSVVGITDAMLLACQQGLADCLVAANAKVGGEAVRSLQDAQRLVAAEMASRLAPTVREVVAAAEESCVGVLPAKPLGAPRTDLVLTAATLRPLLIGGSSPAVSNLARRVLCCRDSGPCSPSDVARAANIIVQRQFGLLPEVASAESMRKLLVAIGSDPKSAVAPAVLRVQTDLVAEAAKVGINLPAAKGTLMDSIDLGVKATIEVGKKRGEAAAQLPREPSQGAALMIILSKVEQCARQPDVQSTHLCTASGPDAWKDPVCADRLKRCGAAVKWSP
jgi:hypothetical protein